MHYELEKNGNLTYTFNAPFDLKNTVTSGQIFRFYTEDDFQSVYIPLRDRIIKITQLTPFQLLVSSNLSNNLESLISKFLRVDDDYNDMVKKIQIDSLMKKIVEKCKGLRLLRQDLFESMIEFILSQCSNIPRITQNLTTISSRYGKKSEFEGIKFYIFPKFSELKDVTEEDLRDLGIGYRAKYIHKLIHETPEFLQISNFCIDEVESGITLNKKFNEIYGIGNKVADCIQLFGCGDLSLFPVDTWMKKFMLKYYIKEEKMSEAKIRKIGQDLFGEWAGYAQQFIFHYARVFDKNL